MNNRTRLIVLALGFVGVVGCSSDDDSGSNDPALTVCKKIDSCSNTELYVSVEECARGLRETFQEIDATERCQECMANMTCSGLGEFFDYRDGYQDNWPCQSYCPP